MRGNFSLKSLAGWRLLRGEKPLSKHIPILRFVEADLLSTKNGALMRVFRLHGLPFETMDESAIEAARDLLAEFYDMNASPNTAFYMHTIRRRVRSEDLPSHKEIDGFAGYVESLRHSEMENASLFHIEHYLTVVQSPGHIEKFMKFSRRKDDAQDWVERRSRTKEALDNICLNVEQQLARLNPERLVTALDAKQSETLSFLSTLVNGVWFPCSNKNAPIDTYLSTHRPIFRGETIELRGPAPEDTRFVAMLGLKAYAQGTVAGSLNALLGAPVEFLLTQSFTPMDSVKAVDRMKWARRVMQVGDDDAQSLADELEDGMDDVAAGRVSYGEHSLTLAVLADRETDLAKSTSALSAVLSGMGFRPVREDVALEAMWHAQMPGNLSYRARKALISSKNFADLASGHNYSQGYKSPLRWGEPMALLETTSGTPYYFSLHRAEAGNANGNTLITGPTGCGKTAFVNHLLTSSSTMACKPRAFYFDKDRGAEPAIRALGGSYCEIAAGKHYGFNPFKFATDERGKAWLRQWIAARVGGDLTPRQYEAIEEAVNANAEAEPALRRFRFFVELFNSLDDGGEVLSQLRDWFGAGARAWLFDAEKDGLNLNDRIAGFEMKALLTDQKSGEAFIDYLFYRLECALDEGVPTLIILDEAWLLLKSGKFAAQIEDWLRTVRKQNGAVVFITQNPEDLIKSDIAATVISNTVTKVYFPNDTASGATYMETFGLSETEFQMIRETQPEQRVFLVRQGNSAAFVRFDLSAMPEVLKVLSASSSSLLELDSLRDTDGENWLEKFIGVSA